MHAEAFLHNQLRASQPSIHQTRLTSLTKAVAALLSCEVLQLTAIGRALQTTTSDKYSIKRIDRLLCNHALAQERVALYRWQAQRLVGDKKHPVILVDYSDVNATRTRVILRASLPVEGRSLVLYEEVHDHDNYAPYWTQFLITLKSILPSKCCPILVTDAGFRGPWRKAVLEMGWYYVMRQRNRDLIRLSPCDEWRSCKTLYAMATTTPKAVGHIEIHRADPGFVDAYVYERKAKCREKTTVRGVKAQSRHSKKNADREREPWLLLSNLPHRHNIAKKVVAIYAARMQIEESFRDLKSHRYGFSFRGTQCEDRSRLQILLLIASLAYFVAWLMGLFAERHQLHRGMQANTEKKRRVLSVCTIGLNLYKKRVSIKLEEWLESIKRLNRLASSCY